MKRLTFALVVLFSGSLFAQVQPVQEVRRFQVEDAQFSPSHVQAPTTASLTIDYPRSQVTLQISRAMPPCPAGRMCAQVMPQPVVVQLPITSVTEGDCGVLHVTAEQDLRPVDGALNKILIDDSTEMNCQTFIRYESKATYETSFFDRLKAKEVTIVSTMILDPILETETATTVETSTETLNFIKGSFLQGFPSYLKPNGGTLAISSDQIEMNVDVHMNCMNRICPRVMPQPLRVKLPVVKVEKTECANVITARRDGRQSDGALEEVKIMDYQHSACRFLVKPLVEVQYRSSYAGRMETTVYEAAFSFDR